MVRSIGRRVPILLLWLLLMAVGAGTAQASDPPTPWTTLPSALSAFADCGSGGASWCGGFDAEGFAQWDGYDGVPHGPTWSTANDGRYFGLDDTLRLDGTSAFRATVDDGAVVPGETGQRTLISLFPNDDPTRGRTQAFQGADEWYRTAVYFPSGFTPSPDTSWNWLVEWHDWPDSVCCANLGLTVVTNGEDGGMPGHERLSMRVLGGGTPADAIPAGFNANEANATTLAIQKQWLRGPNIQRDHWYDVLVHVHWSTGTDGLVEWWLDGRPMGSVHAPTLYYYADNNPNDAATTPGPGQAYLMEGYYRPSTLPSGETDTSTATVLFDATRIGPTADAVLHPTTFADCGSGGASWCGGFDAGGFGRWDGFDGVPHGPTASTANDGRYFGLDDALSVDGTTAFRATVDDAAVVPGEAGQKTLVSLFPNDDPTRGRTQAFEGADEWYRTAVYFPDSFTPSPSTSWNWLVEWQNWPDSVCCANLGLTVVTNGEDGGPTGRKRLSLRVLGGGSPADPIPADFNANDANGTLGIQKQWLRGPTIQRDHWYDVLVHVHWSTGADGAVEWWLDGRPIAAAHTPTLFYYADNDPNDAAATPGPGQAYLTEGYYRPSTLPTGLTDTSTDTVLFDATRIGPTADAVR